VEFRWIEWNLAKIASHGVAQEEAEYVVEQAKPPYPEYREDEKLLVWGATQSGRRLQVVFLLDPDDAVFVIHARPLTNREKRRLGRRRRKRGQR
jgi:uncharacterized DUF497 family protein